MEQGYSLAYGMVIPSPASSVVVWEVLKAAGLISHLEPATFEQVADRIAYEFGPLDSPNVQAAAKMYHKLNQNSMVQHKFDQRAAMQLRDQVVRTFVNSKPNDWSNPLTRFRNLGGNFAWAKFTG